MRDLLSERATVGNGVQRRGPGSGCENAAIADLLDKRLAFVTGKGGVGKTTVAYALGLAAVSAGKRVIVCEIASQERGSGFFGRAPVGFAETRLARRLWTISIDPDLMLREYLQVRLPVRAMGDLLYRSRLFTYLAAATPGLAEMVTMGKVWELAQDRRRAPGASRTYDLVIVDAPATGHGVGFLQTPRNFREMARVGPLAAQASRIEATLEDAETTGIALVARAEEMAVNETIALEAALAGPPEGRGFAVDRVYANGLYPRRFSPSERRLIEERRTAAEGAVSMALAAAAIEWERAEAQRGQLERLRDGVASPPVELPYVFAPRIGVEELHELAAVISQS